MQTNDREATRGSMLSPEAQSGPVRGLARGLAIVLALVLAFVLALRSPALAVDFARDIKPILANHCWNCHGPDEAGRQADLRLDLAEAAQRPTAQGTVALVPGKPAASELMRRIEATDEAVIMPPPEIQKPLSLAQRQLLRQWIEEGAEYAPHWAFVPPQRPARPIVQQTSWPRQEIDYFVLHRLEQEGLTPSPEADRATWLRRVTLDLTGLPPTPAEVQQFQHDSRPDAYEQTVDKLLRSPRHAERMAMHWLDAARFADTNGYNNDEVRTMWPWRDWLISAFAQGMPYDELVRDQLAGDLLPDATLAQRVASGFNRNHVLTTEGGIIEEEYHVEYVADRVHTTSTVFLGLSMQCARCHDHKFDPITQRDYYQFAAFFDNVPDKLVSYRQARMAEPLVKVPTHEQRHRLQQLNQRQAELDGRLATRNDQVAQEMALWERGLDPRDVQRSAALQPVAYFSLDEPAGDRFANPMEAGSVQSGVVSGQLERIQGRYGRGIRLHRQGFVQAASSTETRSITKPFAIACWFEIPEGGGGTLVSKMKDSEANRGVDLLIEGQKIVAHLIHQWPQAAIKVTSQSTVTLQQCHHVVFTYDGSGQAGGVQLFLDGQPVAFDVVQDNLGDRDVSNDSPWRLGQRENSVPLLGALDEVYLFDRVLEEAEVDQVRHGWCGPVARALQVTADQRTPDQSREIVRYYVTTVDPVGQSLQAELRQIDQAREALEKAIPAAMTMGEMPERRQTRILRRGQYDQPGDVVLPGVPVALGSDSTQRVETRLQLADWLLDPQHPLTARVAVNRWWEMIFGTGLVETSEDFGIQGAPPSHPALLDWLATELVQSDWDWQKLLKQMVLSATYRQASEASPALWRRDPQNRWLARGPRYRLPAEVVRDNALAISGLLTEKMGGPSVKPYQPAGLWEDVSVERRDKYVVEQGENLYRRSMYTFWKRTCPPPTMTGFDAPDRETCTVRRARTNTPLQALVLLNDPTYVEAARKLAELLLLASPDDESRLHMAYLRALARAPRPEEVSVLMQQLEAARNWFQQPTADAQHWLAVGQASHDPQLNSPELAAWTTVTSVLLNLDEVISKR